MTRAEVARTAVMNLLHNRDWMGHQLAHALGCMPDGQLEELGREHMALTAWDREELVRATAVLVGLIGEAADSDTVSVALGCTWDEASGALEEVARSL